MRCASSKNAENYKEKVQKSLDDQRRAEQERIEAYNKERLRKELEAEKNKKQQIKRRQVEMHISNQNQLKEKEILRQKQLEESQDIARECAKARVELLEKLSHEERLKCQNQKLYKNELLQQAENQRKQQNVPRSEMSREEQQLNSEEMNKVNWNEITPFLPVKIKNQHK